MYEGGWGCVYIEGRRGQRSGFGGWWWCFRGGGVGFLVEWGIWERYREICTCMDVDKLQVTFLLVVVGWYSCIHGLSLGCLWQETVIYSIYSQTLDIGVFSLESLFCGLFLS